MSEGTTFRKIATGSVVIFIGNVLGVGALFLTRLFAARYYSPSDYGLLVLGVTVLNIVTLISLLGFPQGISQKIPRTEEVTSLVNSAIYPPIGLAVLLALFILVGADLFVNILNYSGLEPVLMAFSIGIPFFVFIRIVEGIFRGSGDSLGRVISRNFLTQGLVLFGVTTSIFIGLDVVSISIVWSLSLILGAIGSGTFLLHRIDILSVNVLIPSKPFQNRKKIRELVVFSFPLMISGLSAQLLKQVDNLLLGYYLTSKAVGLYDAAFLLGMSLQILISSFGFMTLPVISELHVDEAFERMDRTYKLTSKWMVFSAFPLYAVLVARPEWLFTRVFGEPYGEANSLVLILVASSFFSSILLGLNGNALTAVGQTRVVMVSNIVAVVLNVVLNILLIPRFGIVGAAAASFGSLFSLNTLRSVYLYRETGVQPFYRRSVVPILGSASFAIMVIKAVEAITSNPILLFTVISIGHLLIISLLRGIETEELEILNQARQLLSDVK